MCLGHLAGRLGQGSICRLSTRGLLGLGFECSPEEDGIETRQGPQHKAKPLGIGHQVSLWVTWQIMESVGKTSGHKCARETNHYGYTVADLPRTFCPTQKDSERLG